MRHFWIPVAAFVALGSLFGCGGSRRTTTAVVITSESAPAPRVVPGPPPHAPANGYRYKHRNCELVYDSRLELYVVVGTTGKYYSDGTFYRVRGHKWYSGRDADGPWRVVRKSALPRGLMAVKEGHKGRGRGATAN